MPQDSAALNTQLGASATKAVAGSGPIVTVTLKFKGVTYDPQDIYEALNAQYGTVTSDRDTQGQGALEFTIAA